MKLNQASEITTHYGSDDLGTKIFAALVKAGKDPENLQLKDISVIDQLHTGGHLATLELAKRASISQGASVLDAGCGIGGSCRLLTQAFKCKVTGIDLVAPFIEVARQLSHSTRTMDLLTFTCGDILNTGLPESSFDVVWSQHTLMNIRDKKGAFAEFERVLKPGGMMVLHEIVQGVESDIHLPVPWADKPEISFLIPWQEMESLILNSGFTCHSVKDRTDQAKLWWEKVGAATRQSADAPPRPLGPHIIFGDNGKLFGHTMSSNLNEGRIGLIEAICRKF